LGKQRLVFGSAGFVYRFIKVAEYLDFVVSYAGLRSLNMSSGGELGTSIYEGPLTVALIFSGRALPKCTRTLLTATLHNF
jgi:hypothetical protein